MAAQAALECADSARAQRNYLMVLLGVVNCALLTAFLSLNAYGGQHLWSQLSSGILHHVGLQPPKMPWAPLLTGEEQGKGVSHYGGGARLRAVAAKLLAGQPVKAFTLGGSVTYGHGVDDLSLAYSSLFFRYLNETFPHSGHKLVNWGLPGSTSPVTTPCVHSMVDQDADLAVVEFTANDSPSAWTSRGKKGFESLLRTLLALPGQPAVVLLHHYPWFKATGDGANAGLFYREPEGQLTTFSQYYDLPSLSLRSAAWRLMQAGIDGFRVDRVILEGSRDASTGEPIPAAEPGTEASFMYLDTIHPGPSGHQVLAELLVGLMERAVGEVVMNAEPTTRQDARLQGLPPPMIPNHQDSWPTFCAQLEDFEPMVAQQRGFQYAPEKPLLPRLEEQKWGWAAVDPGAKKQCSVFHRHLRVLGPEC